MDDAMSAIRRAIIDEEVGEMTLTPPSCEPLATKLDCCRDKQLPQSALRSTR
jgi:hypothetical protein